MVLFLGIKNSFFISFLSFSFILLSSQNSYSDFIVGHAENWPPYSYKGKHGQADGILIKRLNDLVVRPLMLDVNHQILPWARAQQQVEEGEFDAMIAVSTSSRMEYSQALGPIVCEFKISAYLSSKSVQINQMLSSTNPLLMSDTSCIIMRGDKSALGIANAHGIECDEVTSLEQGVKMVSRGRSDLLIHDKIAVDRLMEKDSLSMFVGNGIVEHPIPLKTIQSRLMVSYKSPFFQSLKEPLDRLYEEQIKSSEENQSLLCLDE